MCAVLPLVVMIGWRGSLHRFERAQDELVSPQESRLSIALIAHLELIPQREAEVGGGNHREGLEEG